MKTSELNGRLRILNEQDNNEYLSRLDEISDDIKDACLRIGEKIQKLTLDYSDKFEPDMFRQAYSAYLDNLKKKLDDLLNYSMRK